MHLPLWTADVDPLVACPGGSRTESWLHDLGIPTVPIGYRSMRHSGGWADTLLSVVRGLRSARELRGVLRANRSRTIVCGTSVRPGLLASVASVGLRRQVVWVVTDFLPGGWLGRGIRVLAWLSCAGVAPSSSAIARNFAGRSRRIARRTRVIYPGVDVNRFAVASPPTGSPAVGIVGHVSETKQTHLAVEIIGRVTEDVPELRLRVIGRAQYRDEDFAYERRLHERVASDPRLRDKVTFDGYSDDVAASLGECHLLLHCRPDEPFGIVLIEAMSLGLPVVAPLGGGPCEIVDDGKTGRLFAPGDVEVAAAAVRELLTDRRRAAAMGTAGRERVCSHFSEVQLVEGFESLFTLLSGPL